MTDDEYYAQEKARKHALDKLHEAERAGAPLERAFMRYLARLDKAGCGLTIPLGWCVDNPAPGFTPPPSPWIKVIETFRDRRQNDPAWLAQLRQEVAREDDKDKAMGVIGCGATLLIGAALVWWFLQGLRH